MGVRGLLTYLKKHPKGRYSMSLYTVARKIKHETGKTPKLICDFLNIFFWLMSEFHEAKVKCKDYQTYSCLYGGDLNEYADRFIAFIHALRRVGVDPIFFLDGERGSDLEGFMAKLETYQKRHDGRIENCSRLIKYDPKHQGDTTHAPWIKPPMLGLHILMALKAEGVEMIHCITEADECMAQYYAQAQGDICGILTNDTDMVMMRGLEVFPCTFFDREAKLGIRTTTFDATITDITYESVAPASLARVLNLSEDDLKNLSIICGNDYTKGLNMTHDLIKQLNFTERRPVIENVAEWLRTTPHMPLHETSPLKEICEKSDGKYKEAIDHTYKAYSTRAQDPPAAGDHKGAVGSDDVGKKKGYDSPHYDMILEETRNGRMIRDLLPMAANSIHWRTVVIEDVDNSVTPPLKCIYDLLLPIRHLVYKLLGLQTVMEYGRSTIDPYNKISIAVKDSDPSFLAQFRERSALEKLCLLTTFLSKAHILETGSLAEFQTPLPLSCDIDREVYLLLIKSLVLCGSLLFSYDLRGDSVFGCDHVQDIYLITTCLCCLKLPLRKVCARPTSHAINIATGFAITIKHSYYLASLLGLHESMPLPGEMYQSAALIPFFHVASSKPSVIKHQLLVNKEMAETLHAYRHITTQLPSFRRLTKLLEEIHCSLPSIHGLIPPCKILNLAVAFMEVVADIDETNQQQLLFVNDQPTAAHTDKHHKGKRMLHKLVAIYIFSVLFTNLIQCRFKEKVKSCFHY